MLSDSYFQRREELRRRGLRLGSLAEELFRQAIEAVYTNNSARAQAVIARDVEVDTEEVAIESEVIRLLGLHRSDEADLRLLCATLKINNDLERIADCAVNIAQRARQVDGRIPAECERELRLMDGLVRRMLRMVLQAWGTRDLESARQALRGEPTVDALHERIVQSLTADISTGREDVVAGLDLIVIANNMERIADLATNIAEDVFFTVTGQIVRHSATWRAAVLGKAS